MVNPIQSPWGKIDLTLIAGDSQEDYFLGELKVDIVGQKARAHITLNRGLQNYPDNLSNQKVQTHYTIKAASAGPIQDAWFDTVQIKQFPSVTQSEFSYHSVTVIDEDNDDLIEDINDLETLPDIERSFLAMIHTLFQAHCPNALF